MKSIISLALLLATVISAESSTAEIYQPGPYITKHKQYNSLFIWGLDHSVDVWAPAGDGTFPVVYFITGLAGMIPASSYATVCERIASHGYVVLGIWTLSALPMTQIHPQWLKEIDFWLQKNLHGYLSNDGFHPQLVVDFSNTFLMAHSAGNHVTVNYVLLENGCDNIQGMIMLSPVDGLDPYGILEEYCIEPGTKLGYESPTLLMPAGLDHLPGLDGAGAWYPACAPDHLSNLRFWDALNGEAWFINATDYGHTDMMEENKEKVSWELKICACGAAPCPVYQEFVAGQIVAFMKGVKGDCEVLKYLEDQSLMTIATSVKKQEGSESICQKGGYCIHL